MSRSTASRQRDHAITAGLAQHLDILGGQQGHGRETAGRAAGSQAMTDAQRVQLIREIAEQAMTGQLSDQEAMTAVALVLEPGGLGYCQVAMLVHGRVAHLGD